MTLATEPPLGGMLTVVSMLALLSACTVGGTARGPSMAPDTDASAVDGELVVFAAASLTDVIDGFAAAFDELHPDVTLVTNLAASQTLAGQLLAGARADVLAVADPAAMDRVVADGLATTSVDFAENRLEIVVEPGNPLGVRGLGDLSRQDLVLVLPTEEAAAGRYAREILDAADVDVTPSSLETDTRAATSRVAMGEADATVAFRSDVIAAAGRVDGVAIPDHQNVLARYPIAVLEEAQNPRAAAAFVALIRSDAGRNVLETGGFGVPR